MLNNTTCFLLQPSFINTSNFSCATKNHKLQVFFNLSLIVLVVIAILSPVAVVGNGLVLAAIWRNPSLRTPSYILLAGLAFTDFCTGIITESCFVANELINLIDPHINLMDKNSWPKFYLIARSFGDGCYEYLFYMILLIITLMSIERWLHMSRRSLITVRRLYCFFAVLVFLPIPLAVYRIIGRRNIAYIIAGMSVMLLCLAVTTVAYCKVFHIIRRHQQQIHTNESSQNPTQPTINLEKYKKSAFSILYIVMIFYIGYLPMAITSGLLLFVTENVQIIGMSFYVSVVFVFMSSSLNPLLYLWRMKDIRNEVRNLVKQIFCKGN